MSEESKWENRAWPKPPHAGSVSIVGRFDGQKMAVAAHNARLQGYDELRIDLDSGKMQPIRRGTRPKEICIIKK